MNGKELRISNLFNRKTGKAVIIPVDHGAVMGAVSGLTDPVKVLGELLELDIDGTLMSFGLAKVASHLFGGKDSPARILTADYPLLSIVPGESDSPLNYDMVSTVETALRWNFDAVKVMLLWGCDKELQMKNLKQISKIADECSRWDMPLMIEPVLWGPAIPADRKSDPVLIANAARISLELGADILKIAYTGDIASFADLVKVLCVPVLVLGGPKMNSTRGVLEVAREAVQAGARGIVFGRNVWQHSSMKGMVRALQGVVHHNQEVDKAMTDNGL